MYQLCGKAASVWFIHKLDNPPSPSQPDCFVSFPLCALLPYSFPPCAIRHKPSQKLQTGREIKAHQLQSQNGKTSLPVRSVIRSEQYPNAWESTSDEILTSTTPTEQRLEAHWKISEVTLKQPLQQRHWEVKVQTERNPEDDNPIKQGRELSLRRGMTTEYKQKWSSETHATALTTREYTVGWFSVQSDMDWLPKILSGNVLTRTNCV